MLAPALAMALAVAPFTQQYVMTLDGVPVGRVRVALSSAPNGYALEYASEALVRRGPVVTRNTAEARAALSPELQIETLTSTRREGGVRVRTVSAKNLDERLRIEIAESGGRAVAVHESRLVPSSLALLLLPSGERVCIATLDELTGSVGELCGTRSGARASGTMMGEAFTAELDGEVMKGLLLPGQRVAFTASSQEPTLSSPPDLFGRGFETEGLEAERASRPLRVAISSPPRLKLKLPSGPSQAVRRENGQFLVSWSPAEPPRDQPLTAAKAGGDAIDGFARQAIGTARDRWSAARRLARQVAEAIADKRPAAFERSALRVFEEARGSCVGHTELFLEAARRIGLPARRAVGIVAQGERFFAHSWAQVEVAGRWYDVEPTEGEAPPRTARVLFTAGEGGEAAGGLLGRAHELKLKVVP